MTQIAPVTVPSHFRGFLPLLDPLAGHLTEAAPA
jgi:hypothetical protein